MLVGGGELHETFDSLVRTERPLSRGIQRFTGITQGMVDARAAARGGAAGAGGDARRDASSSRTTPASTSRCCARRSRRAGLDWPKPPALCTVTLARRFAPLVRKRGLASLADSLGIEVEEVHRALPDALTCARVLCALFPRLCANAPTIGDAVSLLRGHRRARKTEAHERIPPDQRPDLSTLPDDPGVYIFRDEHGRPLYVGKSISLRTRARAHFCAPAGWTERAEIVDYRSTNSELGALVLENRLIKEWRPAGQPGAQADRALLLPALPARHPLPRLRRRGRARSRPRGQHRAAREPLARARSWPTSSPRSTACASAAASSSCASTRRRTGRWAAASRPASATSTRTRIAASSTPRWRTSRSRARASG